MHHEYNMPIIEIEAIRASLLTHGRRRINETMWIDTILVSTKKNINRETFNFSPDSDADFTINVIYFFVGNSGQIQELVVVKNMKTGNRRVYLKIKRSRVSKQYPFMKNIFGNSLNFTL